MPRNKNNNVTIILVLILLLLFAVGIYLFLPVIKNTGFYKNYQSNKEVTFVSKRANFSFKHPNWWPITPASDNQLKENNTDFVNGKPIIRDNEVENIDFEEQWVRNAGGSRLGAIIVEKTNYKNLKEYVDDISKEKVIDLFVKGTDQKVTVYPPKIEYLKIGGEDAISVTDTNALPSFSSEIADYRLIRNGLLYRFVIVDSSRFLENKEKNSQTFQQIISSIKFFRNGD